MTDDRAQRDREQNLHIQVGPDTRPAGRLRYGIILGDHDFSASSTKRWAGRGGPRFRIAASVRNAAGDFNFIKSLRKVLIDMNK